jgi:signal transduction histidine kinase
LLVTVVGVLNLIAFVALTLVALRQWVRRRDRAAGRLTLAFGSLGVVAVVGSILPDDPHGLLENAVARLDIAVLLLFPLLLVRFATTFDPPSPRLRTAVLAMTSVLAVWTLALPRLPAADEPRPRIFVAYVIAFLVHWTLLTSIVTYRLWHAGRAQPAVARTRMEMLAVASAAITLAIFAVAISRHPGDAGAVVGSVIGFVSAVTFLLGIAPPELVRMAWRRSEQDRLQSAISGLMTLATTREEVAGRVLPPTIRLVGARAAALVTADGRVVGVHGLPADAAAAVRAGEVPQPWPDAEVVQTEEPGATLIVWTSPYAPFFGEDELGVLRTLTALTGIALDRVRLFEQEHEARLALEHANAVMTNFVALAAHELRTPVTTIHGFVLTLNRRGDRLTPDQRIEAARALEQQTTRMAALVEQLLDLSRLDAERIEVRPQVIELRPRVEEMVSVAAGPRVEDVVVDVPEQLDACVDPAVLDRILTNLVTNAFRYGKPPIRISAERDDGDLRVAVEDRGPGVADEIAHTLFERFTRAGVARDRVPGTGLGLAIARAYAQAHRGELHYEQASPHGARFVLHLPAAAA